MTEILIATIDELRTLTKREREVYEMFRHEGKTREEICTHLNIGKDAFRRHWWSAIKTIRRYRQLKENPQYYMSRGRDVLKAQPTVQRAQPADTMTIRNTSDFNREPVAEPEEEIEV